MIEMYCPWQKDIRSIKTPANYSIGESTYINTNYSIGESTYINTKITFGECLKDSCPFFSKSSYPNCKRAIEEVRTNGNI